MESFKDKVLELLGNKLNDIDNEFSNSFDELQSIKLSAKMEILEELIIEVSYTN